jgi:hypothetical protein
VISVQAASLTAALLLVLAALAFDACCLLDLARRDVTFVVPPQIWFCLILLFTPFGGIAYWMLERRR